MQNWSYSDSKLFGIFILNGVAISGVQVQLLKGTTHQDMNVTDEDGNWSFEISSGGIYNVKFYGAGAVENDWITNINIESFAIGNLDNIPDGEIYKRTDADEKQGAGRAYSVINESLHVVGDVYSSDGLLKLLDVTGKTLVGKAGATIIDLDPASGTARLLNELISAGIITGGRIRTSEDGQRIEILDDHLEFYNSSGDLVFLLSTEEGNLQINEEPGEIDVEGKSKPAFHKIEITYSTGTLGAGTVNPFVVRMIRKLGDVGDCSYGSAAVYGQSDIPNSSAVRGLADNSNVYAGTFAGKVLVDGNLIHDNILKAVTNKDDSDKTDVFLHVDLKKLDDNLSGVFGVNNPGFIEWWISDSAIGGITAIAGSQNYTVNSGAVLSPDPVDTSVINKSYTAIDGTFELEITNAHSGGETTYYLHVQVQNVVYIQEFSIYTT